ncbi:hypothetical protein THIX_100024 [Thiomonas sp. X19]|nr:hypothetical protein THIX_100024 [Thiomonas sp. X19]
MCSRICSATGRPRQKTLCNLFLARRISDVGAGLRQTVVQQRYKHRRSLIAISNRVVQDWGQYLGDATMATPILDRLMHRAAMLEFEGKSYRLNRTGRVRRQGRVSVRGAHSLQCAENCRSPFDGIDRPL